MTLTHARSAPSQTSLGMVATILLAGIWAYHNTFRGELIFDDPLSETVHFFFYRLWPPWDLLRQSVRPLTDFSFALNYALWGEHPEGPHVLNLTIHLMAAMTLFDLIRWTLLHGRDIAARYRRMANWLAFGAALAWVSHPLNTQSVTYLAQRAESLMGFWYLLTVYCVGRGAAAARHAARWFVAAVIACACGMASKPVMGTAPVVALLYDRVFFAGSLRQVWRRRKWLYVGFIATWGLLAALLSRMASVTLPSAGFGFTAISPLAYAATQPGVILHYLRLVLWPAPLCFDYAWPPAPALMEIVPALFGLGALLGLTGWLWRRRPALGFLGAWFFIILAPTSSIIPIADPAVEHRMYLPAIAVVLAVVIGAWELLYRGIRRSWVRQGCAIGLLGMVTIALGAMTIRRNADYRTAVMLWTDTVRKRPANARAYNNLGAALLKEARFDQTIAAVRAAAQLDPAYSHPQNNWGVALAGEGRDAEALPHFEQAVRLQPNFAEAQHNWGLALMRLGRYPEALRHFQTALQLQPESAEIHHSWGVLLAREGRAAEAMAQFTEAVRLQPTFAQAHYDLGLALMQQRQYEQGLERFAAALRLRPDFAEVYNTMGLLLARQRDWARAEAAFRTAIRLKPAFAQAHDDLGQILVEQGHFAEAGHCFEEALRLDPTLADARRRLNALLSGRPSR